MKNIFKDLKRKDHKRYLGGLDVFKVSSINSIYPLVSDSRTL